MNQNNPVKSFGIVGCGAIGCTLMTVADAGGLSMKVAGITSRTEKTAREFLSTLHHSVPYLELPELVSRSDLIVEAAGLGVVPELARVVFKAGKDLMVISVGALLDHPEIMREARETGCRLFLPSGAIAGLDGIKSACMGNVSHVTMTTRKPSEGLEGAPYLIEHGITLTGLKEQREVFSGTAREACRGFPANLNVSAAVSLAGLGPDETKVRIFAVPGLTRNCHDLEIEGEFGRLSVSIENIPSENPRTGRLTTLSIIRTLQDIADFVRIGT